MEPVGRCTKCGRLFVWISPACEMRDRFHVAVKEDRGKHQSGRKKIRWVKCNGLLELFEKTAEPTGKEPTSGPDTEG